ncbi:MAG TPA: J domain-containing protein [Allocoleopsis sp.]
MSILPLFFMELADCYRLLGLRKGASYEDIKASYRRLARRYHPDANPTNQQYAKEKFIQLTDAYRRLISVVQPTQPVIDLAANRNKQGTQSPSKPQSTPQAAKTEPAAQPVSPQTKSPQTKSPQGNATRSSQANSGQANSSQANSGQANSGQANSSQASAKRKPPPIQISADLAPIDRQLKQNSYEQLQQLLREGRFPRAIAVVEGLAQRLPLDVEVRQWQAITYQRFGRYLIGENQPDKAKLYLKKALRTDPQNKSLWYEVDRDLRRIEQVEIL